ncbi:glucose-6-phosphate dehydrogenase assembly protein OpcA [Buchananella felis]|uniref:glucose-6-phosphate dehydrogenase assembly protein OpcA n=1 Tax=Buchananella felis TaxID=3231492 RepID=UPI003528BDEC
MRIKLAYTSSAKVAARLLELRESGGSSALGRVLTLVVVVPSPADVEDALAATTAASLEHPCRVIVVTGSCATCSEAGAAEVGMDDAAAPANGAVTPCEEPRLDAEIRVGRGAGASDIVVLNGRGEVGGPETLIAPLLLPDSPIVVWWPTDPPKAPSQDPLGKLAHRRITDSRGTQNPIERLKELAQQHVPGDSDLSWSGVTIWRSLIVLAAGEPPLAPITSVDVWGSATHPAGRLIGAWLRVQLGVPVRMHINPEAATVNRVVLHRETGDVEIDRPVGSAVAVLRRPGVPDVSLALPRRTTADCLMEELRRLDVDAIYAKVISQGLELVEEVQ